MTNRKPTSEEEKEDRELAEAKIMNAGQAARRLLDNPLVAQFFKEEDIRAWEAIKAASLPCKHEIYIGLHAYADAVEKLRKKLHAAVEAAATLQIRKQR